MVIKKKILVTGANGQLGKELQELSTSFAQFDFIFLAKETLPIHEKELVEKIFETHRPQFLINCAAYTAVDKAETEKGIAYEVNAVAPGLLAAICKKHQCKFLHISTDYVFDGTATIPYKEDSTTNPQSVYGASKLEGERMALHNNPDSIIIRTSWVYSEFGKNFVKTMINLMAERPTVNVVNDQVGSPTYAADLAKAILNIITSQLWKPGIYHFSNKGIISWYDLAVAIKELTGSKCVINAIPGSQYPTPAKRPAWSVLDGSKLFSNYGIEQIDWKESLSLCLQHIK